jgi:hypothetical protein
MEDSFGELTKALIISIFLVYAILVMLYESYLIPAIPMLSVPLGLVGALLAFFITWQDLKYIILYRLDHAGRIGGQKQHPVDRLYPHNNPTRGLVNA